MTKTLLLLLQSLPAIMAFIESIVALLTKQAKETNDEKLICQLRGLQKTLAALDDPVV